MTNGSSTMGTITGGTATAVTYHAPSAMPPGNPLTVTATSLADPSKTASVVLTLLPVAGRPNPVVAVGNQETQGIDFTLPALNPTLALADVGSCTGSLKPLNVTCATSVTGISAAPGETLIMWALGQGLTTPDGSSLAAGLQMTITQGSTRDVKVSNLTPQPPQSGLSNVYFQVQISPSAAPGLRDLVVTNRAGELQHFLGALEITAGP